MLGHTLVPDTMDGGTWGEQVVMMDPARNDQQSTEELIRAFRGGNSSALDELFARYLPRVRQIVSLRMGWKLRRLLEVDDVVQEVLLGVLGDIDRYECRSEGSFHNWLARCVEREIIDLSRAQNRQKRGGGRVRRFADYGTGVLGSAVFAGKFPTPSQEVCADETAERVEEALLELPASQRELIVLRSVCGMSFSEIAAELDAPSEGSLRVAYSRALRKLEDLADL